VKKSLIALVVLLIAFPVLAQTEMPQPAATPAPEETPAPPPMEAPAAEPAPQATPEAVEPPPAPEPARFEGLMEYDRAFLRGMKSRGGGVFEVTPSSLKWTNDKAKARSFDIKGDVVGNVVLNCAKRAAENLCLELRIRTLTANEYIFRDRDWESGGNTQVLALFDYLKTNYPQVVFDQKVVDVIK
jgi:hypothetical protein